MFSILIQTLEIEYGIPIFFPRFYHIDPYGSIWYWVVSPKFPQVQVAEAAPSQPAQTGGKESELRNLVQEP